MIDSGGVCRAQTVVAAIAVIGLIYLLKLVLVTTLVSVLLTHVLEPAEGPAFSFGIRNDSSAFSPLLCAPKCAKRCFRSFPDISCEELLPDLHA